jgi:hypothetical protein
MGEGVEHRRGSQRKAVGCKDMCSLFVLFKGVHFLRSNVTEQEIMR